jgi:hypothetical protein
MRTRDKYTTTIRKNEYGEWVVRFFVDGEHQTEANYFADDRDDAKGTAHAWKSDREARDFIQQDDDDLMIAEFRAMMEDGA